MPPEASTPRQAKCLGCGYEAPAGGDEWKRVDHPPLGTLTQCPECASTNITTR